MADANEMYDAIMQELHNVVISDTDEATDQQRHFSFHGDADCDDIPPSLLSYFETSKSRAAVCEKLILEEPEDFTVSHHSEDMILPTELDKDVVKPNEQVSCDTENEGNNTCTDTRLLPAPTEIEALFTHNVSVCPNNEDEAGTNKCMEGEKHLAFEKSTLEISLHEKDSGEYEAERERRHCEKMKREERKRQVEKDFQRELRRIMEAENLHQKELELKEKRAQEKLEQEFLLQQELISNLQRRVEEERRKREEEQKRMKDEEDKRKREEEKIKTEAERKRKEEETRRRKEEERRIEEMKLKKEKSERRRMEREKDEEERKKKDLEKKKLEDDMRMIKEEENKKIKEEVERIEREEKRKREEERKKIEEARKELERMETEKIKKDEKERKKREEEEGRVTKETEERKKQEEKKEEEEVDKRAKMAPQKLCEEMRKGDIREHGNVDEEIQLEEVKKKEENDRKKKEEEEKKEEARKEEKAGKEMEEKREAEEFLRKQGEDRKMKELRDIEEVEKRKKEDERTTKEKEQRRRKKEKMRKQRDIEDYRKSEELRLKEDEEVNKGHDVDTRKMEHERKTKDRENKKEEEKRKGEEESKNADAEKENNEEEVGGNGKEVNKKMEEEMRLKEKEESKNGVVKDKEKEVWEKRKHNSLMGPENSSQLEDSTTWTSSSPRPLHSESTSCPTSAEATPQKHDLRSRTSTDKTVHCGSPAVRPSTGSVLLPVWLPEHTEKKRLSWMKDCIAWSRLSLQNRRRQKGPVQSRRGPRRAAEACGLPPLCPDSLLQSTGWKSLQEVTTVTLEDLPGCSLSTLARCTKLRSLRLRRCGLKSLEGINQLPQLCYIDAQENDISFVDCENMASLRVLQLGHNQLTSIHGLAGAENLDVLDLSHNSITRIAGLDSVRRLQRLSVDHNQLISTKGLRDVYTLLHLNCSHNHLTSVEGLENSALLSTLDLRANSLTEPPSLNNQVLLRELYLDDNSISSLQGLTAYWLPLMQHLSVAQNRITQLPSMSDFVSLANLDLRFNCMSELQNVCESLQGCQFLREVHLTGNPLMQESGWRSTLQKAVPGLRAIHDQETDSSLSPPAVRQVILASGSFLTFCQAQLQQTHDLKQRHSRELCNASSAMDAVQTSCRHFTEALQLATDQRFAHEYGDTTVTDTDSTNPDKRTECPETGSAGKVPPVIPNRDSIRCGYWTFDEKPAAESHPDTFDTVTTGLKTGPTVSKANSGSVLSLATKSKTISSNLKVAALFDHQDMELQNTAAVVIQQQWRKCRQKCGNISSPSTAEEGGGRGGDGGKPESEPESGPSYINESVLGQDYAATLIQAFWRGFTLRRRLTSALAAVTCPDTGEDDTFEEVDVDEFVFDEEALEKHWTLPLTEDSPPRYYPASEQPLSLKPPGHFPEPSQYILSPPLVWRSKQAWAAGEQVDSAEQRVSPVSSNRSRSPASASVVSGLSDRSEKILQEWGFAHSHTALLMLKRAQKMKSKKQQQNKRDPSVRLALFRNCSYQLGQVEARNRQAQGSRPHIQRARRSQSSSSLRDAGTTVFVNRQWSDSSLSVGEAELGLQQAEKTQRAKEERAQQWLHTKADHSDQDSESVRFLPEISSDILNGGRVQLVADPGYTERLHHASGLWASSSVAAQPCKENNYPRRNSLGHARDNVPSPKRVTSAPSKKERVSFRDNPVQLSGGWGGGKKRDKVYK